MIKKIQVPFCDVCGEPWLPKHRLADGTINLVFEKPDRSKRCGKCKSTRWNAAGVDRRRKVVVEATEEVPQVTVADVEQTVDYAVALELAVLGRHSDTTVAAAADEVAKAIFYPNARCRHGLYSCPECHHQEVA
jgi:hypothetical protein